jgi:hypothetical protein
MSSLNINPAPVELSSSSPFFDTPAKQGTEIRAYSDRLHQPWKLWRSPMETRELLSIPMGQGGCLSLVDCPDHLPGIVQQRLRRRIREGL